MISSTTSGPDPNVMDAINRGNTVVFFDVSLGGTVDGMKGGKSLGRIKLELFVNDVSDDSIESFCHTFCLE